MVQIRFSGCDPLNLPARFLIRGIGRLLTPEEEVRDAALLVEGGRISAIPSARELQGLADLPSVDVGGATVAPGFIDIHVHGGAGADALDGTQEALRTIASFHAGHGTTALLATVATSPWPEVLSAVEAVAEAAGAPDVRGARILGLHLEGPFLNPARRGAQPLESLLPPTQPLLEEVFQRAGGHWVLVTLAPELWPEELIRFLVERGVTVSLGHTDATWAQARRAIALGARQATHLFNAMRPFHHREPGVVGAVLLEGQVRAEIVADGIHVHPAAIALAARMKGPEGIVLVTDAIRAAGLGDGVYELFGQEVTVSGGEARLSDGTLAGSTLTMERAVANMVRWGFPLSQAVSMATAVPAAVAGVESRKGRIARGYDADLVVLDDAFTVHLTFVEGRIAFLRGPSVPGRESLWR